LRFVQGILLAHEAGGFANPASARADARCNSWSRAAEYATSNAPKRCAKDSILKTALSRTGTRQSASGCACSYAPRHH
jgi:hypothetical protein